MTAMPTLETERLIVRPFVMDDLEAIYQILDVELSDSPTGAEKAESLDARREWLEWQSTAYEQLARLYQPPFGDRAVALKASGQLIGAAGYAPYLGPFGQLPSFATGRPADRFNSVELGLYWAISPAYQRQGYASEAARALIAYAFEHLQLKHIIAGTAHENSPSIGVMRKVGMRIEHNLYPDPPWLQVVGILENPAAIAAPMS